jgi:hypothetical protein
MNSLPISTPLLLLLLLLLLLPSQLVALEEASSAAFSRLRQRCTWRWVKLFKVELCTNRKMRPFLP